MAYQQETVTNSWAIIIPSIIRTKYGTSSTTAGYNTIYRNDYPFGFTFDADAERIYNDNKAKAYTEWICANMSSIVQDFAAWLHEHDYDDVLESASFYRGRCTMPGKHLRWVCNDSIIIVKTRGKKVEIPNNDGWVGAPITITTGNNTGKKTKIIKIDRSKACPYTVVIDGEARRYRREQFNIKTRDELRHLISEYTHWSDINQINALNLPSNLGNMDLPGYEEKDPKLQCKIWIDPIITQKMGDMDFENVWTFSFPTEINSSPSAIWKHTKPTKGVCQLR